MGAQIGVLARSGKKLLSLQDLEKTQKTAGRHAGPVEKGQGGLVGRGLLAHRILHIGPLRHALGPEERRAASADYRRRGAQHHRDDALDAGIAHRLLGAGQMAAGDMAGLVRQNAEQLVRGVDAHDQAGVDEFVLPGGDKGIELLVLDQIDVERARLEPRRLPDRRHHRSDLGLDLGVPDEGLGRGGSCDGQQARQQRSPWSSRNVEGSRGRL